MRVSHRSHPYAFLSVRVRSLSRVLLTLYAELGAVVTVTGSNFVSGVVCRFDLVTVASSSWTATQAVCTTPSLTVGTVSVEVSNNNMDFTTAGLTLTVQGMWLILAECCWLRCLLTCCNAAGIDVAYVAPSLGPTTGNTLVTVYGANFVTAQTACYFGATVAVATTVSNSTALVCQAPARAAGSVYLELTNNNRDFTTQRFVYLYYGAFTCLLFVWYIRKLTSGCAASPTVTSVYPTTGSVAGGSVITVTGAGFVQRQTLTCKFGTAVSAAFWHSTVLLTCASPAVAVAGAVALEVSNNNQDYSANAVQFTYQRMSLEYSSVDSK